VDYGVNFVASGLVDERSVCDIAVGRVADLERFRAFGEERRIFLDQPSGHKVAAGGHANLASVVERPEAAELSCVLEVCIL
jgi:hypothetical protein